MVVLIINITQVDVYFVFVLMIGSKRIIKGIILYHFFFFTFFIYCWQGI
jgi:hypothetical protein